MLDLSLLKQDHIMMPGEGRAQLSALTMFAGGGG